MMVDRKGKNGLRLVALDTEGEWNRPLLENAAAMSSADCVFASSSAGDGCENVVAIEKALDGFQHVIACECVRDSVSIYDFAAPRGRTAVIMGNEEMGVPRSVLKSADRVISIPMSGAGMSSLNVAVSAAIALYGLSRDVGRVRRPASRLHHRDVDVLIRTSRDPHEVGSLLRSAWAFGWRRIFLSDPHGVWFTRDPQVILDSRAAARRNKNRLTVIPACKLDRDAYDRVLVGRAGWTGKALSRLRLPACRRLLVELGDESSGTVDRNDARVEGLHVDYTNTGVEGRFRHTNSIVLSVISELLGA